MGKKEAEKQAEGDKPLVGLALSGGGFRATLFHLGVVRFLYEHQVTGDDRSLLQRVIRIASVSGGSILAAELSANWPQYEGEAEEFAKAARRIIRFVKSDLRGRVIRRWLLGLAMLGLGRLFFGWRRTRLLSNQYRRLYGDRRLSGLRTEPRLDILATSYTTGGTVSFTSGGALFFKDVPDLKIETPIGGDWTLSDAVAASSAFPPLFPPVRRSARQLQSRIPAESLGDGGIRDNLGIEFMTQFNPDDLAPNVFIVSNAGKPFDFTVEQGESLEFVVPRTSRMADIQMDRISVADMEDAQKRVAPRPLVRCNIGTDVAMSDTEFTKTVHRRIAQIRTDLNRFNDLEIYALVKHGYHVAAQAWSETEYPAELRNESLRDDNFWKLAGQPKLKNKKPLGDNLRSSRKTRLGLWNPRDPAFYLLGLISLAWVSVLVFCVVMSTNWLTGIGERRLHTVTSVSATVYPIENHAALSRRGAWLKDTISLLRSGRAQPVKLVYAHVAIQQNSHIRARPFNLRVDIQDGYHAIGRLAMGRVHKGNRLVFEEIPPGQVTENESQYYYSIPQSLPDHEIWFVAFVEDKGSGFPNADDPRWQRIVSLKIE